MEGSFSYPILNERAKVIAAAVWKHGADDIFKLYPSEPENGHTKDDHVDAAMDSLDVEAMERAAEEELVQDDNAGETHTRENADEAHNNDKPNEPPHIEPFGVFDQHDKEKERGGKNWGKLAQKLMNKKDPKLLSTHQRMHAIDTLAMSMDRRYAKLLSGHALGISFERIWMTNNVMRLEADHQRFTAVIRSILDSALTPYISHVAKGYAEGNLTNKRIKSLARLSWDVTNILGNEWEMLEKYGLSPAAEAAEDTVLSLLRFKGFFKKNIPKAHRNRIDRDRDVWLKLRLILRRSNFTYHAFAMAVGKSLVSQNLIANSRASIHEHRRSVAHFDNAMINLYEVLKAHGENILMELMEKQAGDQDFVFIHDYRSIVWVRPG